MVRWRGPMLASWIMKLGEQVSIWMAAEAAMGPQYIWGAMTA